MIHITCTTGHSRISPRDEVDRQILALCQDSLLGQLLAGQLAPIPREPGYAISGAVNGSALVATAWRVSGSERVPIATWWVAADASAAGIWDAVVLPHCHRAARQIAGYALPELIAPATTPWVAAWIEIGALMHPAALGWIADLERCLAWAWVDHRRAAR